MTWRLSRPVIFGLSDGCMSILGVVFYVGGHGGLVLPAAVSGGLSAAASMAAGEWLSESGSGPGAALAMGAATLAGSVLPAAPYALLPGRAAAVTSVGVCCAVAAVVARLRAHRRHPFIETAAALAAVVGVSAACAVLLPGGSL